MKEGAAGASASGGVLEPGGEASLAGDRSNTAGSESKSTQVYGQLMLVGESCPNLFGELDTNFKMITIRVFVQNIKT